MADHGNVDAMRAMGYFAMEDFTAKGYLQKAAELNDPYCIMALARALKYGDPEQKKMLAKARSVLVDRINKGDRRAMVAIVCEISRGSLSVKYINEIFKNLVQKEDFFTGVAYYFKALEALHWAAGFDSDKERVGAILDWLEKSAKCGEVRAMEKLAQLYYYGEDNESSGKFPKNLDRAWYWARAYRAGVGCPSPEVDPPVDENGKPWKRPKMKHSQKRSY